MKKRGMILRLVYVVNSVRVFILPNKSLNFSQITTSWMLIQSWIQFSRLHISIWKWSSVDFSTKNVHPGSVSMP